MIPKKLNLLESAEQQITRVFDPHIAGDVNDAQVKIAKIGEIFEWHSHELEDEAFFVLKGRIAIDFRDGSVEMDEGDFIVIPKKLEHRPRSLSPEPIVLLFEPSTTINTGDQENDLTRTDLKRLMP